LAFEVLPLRLAKVTDWKAFWLCFWVSLAQAAGQVSTAPEVLGTALARAIYFAFTLLGRTDERTASQVEWRFLPPETLNLVATSGLGVLIEGAEVGVNPLVLGIEVGRQHRPGRALRSPRIWHLCRAWRGLGCPLGRL
jgi:hypothetical protein